MITFKTIEEIGAPRFCAVVCDSTGNTRSSRNILVAQYPHIFNIPDICHHFSNTLKEIISVDYFRQVRKQIYFTTAIYV